MTISRRRLWGRVIALVAISLLSAGCVPQGLAFRVDDRVTVLSPRDREQVPLPVTLRWSVRDFTVVPAGTRGGRDTGYFAVFIDGAPMPPGQPLAWVARNDTGCRPADGCPSTEYLASRGVYATSQTQLVLQQVPRVPDGKRDRHTATIVLLDGAGVRIGESAFQVVFDVVRGRSS